MSGIARSEIKRALDGRARPSGADHSVTIRGVTYPTPKDAAETLGVSVNAVYKARSKGSLDRIGAPLEWGEGPSPQPVTIRGVTYPTPKAAAKACGVRVGTIYAARQNGTLDRVGLGPKWHTGASHHNAVEITIRGKTYPTIADAAADLGVSANAVRIAKRKGTLDGVGLQKARRRRSAPVTIRGVEHPSPAAAAKALGVDVNEIYRLEKLGRLDEIGPPEDPEDAIVPFDPAASPDHDADGNLTPEAIKRRAADFMRRRAGRRL